MILDVLNQWQRYRMLGPAFVKGFEYLCTLDSRTPPGRVELQGDDLFATVAAYPTRPQDQCRFESHRKYADIQYMIAGRERILWSPLSALTEVTQPYDSQTDLIFFSPPKVSTPLHLEAGQFAVFFPEDGHAPGIEWSGIDNVLKVVVKVRL